MRSLVIFLLAGCAASLMGQDSEPLPTLLLESAHCLATAPGDLLQFSSRRATSLELGYVENDQSHRSRDLLTVVNYTISTHAHGTAFRMVAEQNGHQRILRLLFSVGFRQSDDGSQQIQLVDPPFGGIGTQDEIVSAIRKIGFHTYTVSFASLLLPTNSVRCTSQGQP